VGKMVTLDNFPHEEILTGKEARLAFLIRRYSILADPTIKCHHCGKKFTIGRHLLHLKELHN